MLSAPATPEPVFSGPWSWGRLFAFDSFTPQGPLGVGQRLFFLHDGRTSDLLQAIQAHATPAGLCITDQTFYNFYVSTTS